MSAGACCSVDVAGLRTMLRDEFGARGRRDLAIARAVHDWYLRQHPELVLVLDQPDLFGIVEGIGAPVPQAGNTLMNREEFDAEMKKGADAINTGLNAARYLALRDVPDDQLGAAAGVPCIAMPDGPEHGNYVSGDDADRMIDEAIEKGSAQ